MNTERRFIINDCTLHGILVMAILYITPSVKAQETYPLKYKFHKGERLQYKTERVDSTEAVMGEQTTVRQMTVWSLRTLSVEEANENNNWTATMFTIPEDSAYNPDLIVSNITLNSITDSTVSYTYTIANIGEEGPIGYGPAFAVATFISTDDTFDSSDTTLVEGYSIWSYHLWVGWSQSRYEADTSLAGTPPGDYYLIVVADLKSNHPGVDETNEDNNWTAIPITVPAP